MSSDAGGSGWRWTKEDALHHPDAAQTSLIPQLQTPAGRADCPGVLPPREHPQPRRFPGRQLWHGALMPAPGSVCPAGRTCRVCAGPAAAPPPPPPRRQLPLAAVPGLRPLPAPFGCLAPAQSGHRSASSEHRGPPAGDQRGPTPPSPSTHLRPPIGCSRGTRQPIGRPSPSPDADGAPGAAQILPLRPLGWKVPEPRAWVRTPVLTARVWVRSRPLVCSSLQQPFPPFSQRFQHWAPG